MPRSFPVLIAVAAAIALPNALHAQPQGDPSRAPIYRVDDFNGLHAIGQADFGTNRARDGVPDQRAATDRSYPGPPPQPKDGTTRTSLEHRLAGPGLVGAVGYVCVTDGHPLDGRDAGVDKTSRFGRQDELVGAALNYGFK